MTVTQIILLMLQPIIYKLVKINVIYSTNVYISFLPSRVILYTAVG